MRSLEDCLRQQDGTISQSGQGYNEDRHHQEHGLTDALTFAVRPRNCLVSNNIGEYFD